MMMNDTYTGENNIWYVKTYLYKQNRWGKRKGDAELFSAVLWFTQLRVWTGVVIRS